MTSPRQKEWEFSERSERTERSERQIEYALKEMGVPLYFAFSFFPTRSKLALAYVSLRYTHRSTVV